MGDADSGDSTCGLGLWFEALLTDEHSLSSKKVVQVSNRAQQYSTSIFHGAGAIHDNYSLLPE